MSLLRKGVMCYEHIDSWDKLPAEEKFFSKLNYEGICDKDYRHAQRNICDIKDIGKYYVWVRWKAFLGVPVDFDKNMYEKFTLASFNFVPVVSVHGYVL